MTCYRFRPLSVLALFASALAFTGCGIGPAATNSVGTLQMHGSIFGGQQPVSGAGIKLYAAGKTGNGSSATSLLGTPVTSDANGNFTITGDYTCVNANDQVYLSATGGNPGLAPGTNNAALVMVSALGRCANLPTTPFVSINEQTTVAAAWALAPFINSAPNVGATPTNAAGLANGFLNAALIVDPTSGLVPALAANLTVESGKIAALANSIASCVNSDGGAGCSPLFSAATPSGGTEPTDTLQAALNIVRNPANNVAAVFNAGSSFPPFASTLTSAPNDWTLSLTVTGGGLDSPTAMGLDAGGSVWVAGLNGVLSGFTAQGTPFSASGFGVGTLSQSFGLTIDPNGSIWVSSENMPQHGGTFGSVSKFAGSASGTPGQLIATFSDPGLDFPDALSADTNGNILIANYGNSTASVYSNTGAVVSGGLGAGNLSFPTGVAADSTHGLWLANQSDGSITHLAADGTLLAHLACCNGASAIAVDALGNAWVADFFSGAVTEVSAAGTATLTTTKMGGLTSPIALVIDGAQDIWVSNYLGASITHLAGNASASPAGTALSPVEGLGQDASLVQPFGIGVDATGDVWVSNFANSDVVEFFGVASPTGTPVNPTPAIP
ncbi:MAG: hypothetical protein ABI147_09300 [Acidobacteriaceae bacterium]